MLLSDDIDSILPSITATPTSDEILGLIENYPERLQWPRCYYFRDLLKYLCACNAVHAAQVCGDHAAAADAMDAVREHRIACCEKHIRKVENFVQALSQAARHRPAELAEALGPILDRRLGPVEAVIVNLAARVVARAA